MGTHGAAIAALAAEAERERKVKWEQKVAKREKLRKIFPFLPAVAAYDPLVSIQRGPF